MLGPLAGTPGPLWLPRRVAASAPAFDPSQLPGLALWVSADSGVYSDAGVTPANPGDLVQQWNDRSGNGNHVTQPTDYARPVLVASVRNGLPAIRFDAGGWRMKTPVALTAGDYTIALVYSYRGSDGAANGQRAIQGTNNWLIGPYTGNHKLYQGAFFFGPAVVQDAAVTALTRALAGSQTFRVNGTQYGGSAGASYPGTVGLSAEGAFAEPLNGDIFEVVICAAGLDATQTGQLESYLQSRYAHY